MRWMCLLQLTRGSTWTGDSASRPYLHTRGSTWTGDSASRPYLHTTGVPVSSSLSRYVVGCWWEGAGVGGGWVAGGVTLTSVLSRQGRGGGVTLPGRPSGYLPRIGVRGRLFAGMTDRGSPLRWDGGEGEGMGSRLRGNDDWGAAPGFPPRIRYGAGFSREGRLGGVVKCGVCMLGWRRWYCTWLGCMT